MMSSFLVIEFNDRYTITLAVPPHPHINWFRGELVVRSGNQSWHRFVNVRRFTMSGGDQ